MKVNALKCLIVEDQPLIRADLCLQMQAQGYECHESSGVKKAAFLLKTNRYDLILLDWHVTDGTSQTLVDYLHIVDAHATVILITGSGAFPNGEYADIAPRIDFVLRKPVNLNDLRALVEYSTRTEP